MLVDLGFYYGCIESWLQCLGGFLFYSNFKLSCDKEISIKMLLFILNYKAFSFDWNKIRTLYSYLFNVISFYFYYFSSVIFLFEI